MSDNQQENTNTIRERVIEIAGEKMRRVGIKSISVDDLCRELGMSKKTFYVYFETKDELIRALLRRHEQHIEEAFHRNTDGKPIIDILLEGWVKAMQEKDVRKDPPLHYDLQKYYPQLFEEHIESVRVITKRVTRDILVRGVQEGLFRDDLDVDKTAAIFSFMHHELLNLMATIGEQYHKTIDEHVRYGIDIILRGIISEQGSRLVQERVRDMKLCKKKK